MIGKNVVTDFSSQAFGTCYRPHMLRSSPGGGYRQCNSGKKYCLVSPCASVRGDEGQPPFRGDDSNVQDGVVIHTLETELKG